MRAPHSGLADSAESRRVIVSQTPAREAAWSVDEAELAPAAVLARYSGRTLEAYHLDLRWFFQWTAARGLDVLAVARVHIERRAPRTSSISAPNAVTEQCESSARPTVSDDPARSAQSRTIDLAIGERDHGPILLRRNGQRLGRRTAHRWVRG
jgi:hypothetical protein